MLDEFLDEHGEEGDSNWEEKAKEIYLTEEGD